MVQINFALREVNCKIVYYGPGMSGKTTNLEIVHKKAPENNKGELTSIATEGDRTLFFDFMPLDLGNVAGMRTKFQLYTVPGQVYYNSTRKLVLQGADGVIFVADSSRSKMKENIESWNNLEENLREYGKDVKDVPVVIQWNKRDLPDAMDVAELEEKLNPLRVPTFEAVAITGEGVFPTLKALSATVLESLNRKGQEKETAAVAPRAEAKGAFSSASEARATTAAAPMGAARGGAKVGTRPVGGSTAAIPSSGGASLPMDRLSSSRIKPIRKAPDLRSGRGGTMPGAGRPQPLRPRPKPPQAYQGQLGQEKKNNVWIYVIILLVLAGAAAALFFFHGELGLF